MTNISILKNNYFFNQIDDPSLQIIASISQSMTFYKNEIISSQEDKANCLYIVEEGWIKLFRTSLNGEETIIEILGPNKIIADTDCISESYLLCSFAPVTKTAKVLKIPQQGLLKIIESNPKYFKMMMKESYKKQANLIRKIEESKQLESKIKFVKFLLELYDHNKKENSIKLPYGKNVIASELGTKPETLSRTISSLEKDNLIQTKSKFIVLKNVDKLYKLTQKN